MTAAELTFGDAAPFAGAASVEQAIEDARHHEYAERDRPVFVLDARGRTVAKVRHDGDVERFDS